MKNLFMTMMVSALLLTAGNAKPTGDLQNIPITDMAGYLSNGSFEVKHFVARHGQLWAIGLVTGYVSGKHITRNAQMPVTVTGGTPGTAVRRSNNGVNAILVNYNDPSAKPADCAFVNISFGATDINILGLHLTLAPVDIDLTATDAPADILCAITNLVGAVGNVLNFVVSLLNALVGG
jgi:hypothetical protein